MSGNIVNWGDYQGLADLGGVGDEAGAAMGIASGADIDALNKALTAGSDINNPGSAAGEGFPLRVESLDQTLYNVTYSAKQIKFWRSLAKTPAYNTVEEYNRLEEYGSGDSIFIGEGELPTEDDSTYSRQYSKIKFMGTTRRVTHVMGVLRSAHGEAVARETVNGTLFLLKQIERQLFTGNEDMVDLQFDGLETLLAKAFGTTIEDDGQYSGYAGDNVIDLRGQPLTPDHVVDLTEVLIAEPNYGEPTDLWSSTGPVKDLSKIMFPNERNPSGRSGAVGSVAESVLTPFGNIKLQPNIFIPGSTTAGAVGVGKAALRPSAPTLGTLTSPAYAGSHTNYWGSTDAGAYWYKVVAGSRHGRSVPATSAAAVTVSADDEVIIPVTDNGPDTSYYEVYRSDKDGAVGTCRTIMRVAKTGPSQNIRDLNRFLPNTSKAYLLSQNNQVLTWKQLAPFTKIKLATIDTSVRWMQILYGALQLMKPGHCGMFINVGKLPTGAYQ